MSVTDSCAVHHYLLRLGFADDSDSVPYAHSHRAGRHIGCTCYLLPAFAWCGKVCFMERLLSFGKDILITDP